MRRKLVVANRKMHGNIPDNHVFLSGLPHGLRDICALDCAVCLPHPYLYQAQTLLEGSAIAWGART